jgi:hypothetical protein
MGYSMPWMIDLVLILRVLVIYPFALTPRLKWLMIMFVLFVFKSARLGCLIAIFIYFEAEEKHWKQDIGVKAGDRTGSPLYRSPYYVAVWILEALDNGQVSLISFWMGSNINDKYEIIALFQVYFYGDYVDIFEP